MFALLSALRLYRQTPFGDMSNRMRERAPEATPEPTHSNTARAFFCASFLSTERKERFCAVAQKKCGVQKEKSVFRARPEE